MRKHTGRAAAIGLLCAVAATVAVWSGPLEAASSSLHTSAPSVAQTAPAHVTP